MKNLYGGGTNPKYARLYIYEAAVATESKWVSALSSCSRARGWATARVVAALDVSAAVARARPGKAPP